jgi:hypothetical protein
MASVLKILQPYFRKKKNLENSDSKFLKLNLNMYSSNFETRMSDILSIMVYLKIE